MQRWHTSTTWDDSISESESSRRLQKQIAAVLATPAPNAYIKTKIPNVNAYYVNGLLTIYLQRSIRLKIISKAGFLLGTNPNLSPKGENSCGVTKSQMIGMSSINPGVTTLQATSLGVTS